MGATKLIEDHVFLADVIALDYSNIPGCQLEEARSEAQVALIRAAEAYNPQKGEFIPFSSRVIRNALNSLYAKQLRLLRVFPKSLDDPIQWAGVTATGEPMGLSDAAIHEDPQQDVRKHVRRRETSQAMEAVMNLLTPRERLAVSALKAGNSYSEIGEKFGISKQAAHKSVQAGIAKLRDGLARMGYRGLASDGHLSSSERKTPPLG